MDEDRVRINHAPGNAQAHCLRMIIVGPDAGVVVIVRASRGHEPNQQGRQIIGLKPYLLNQNLASAALFSKELIQLILTKRSLGRVQDIDSELGIAVWHPSKNLEFIAAEGA